MLKFFPTGGSRQQQWCISKADARLWADILEASTPVLNSSTFRQVLKCILGHHLYVPATLEVLCESALKKSLKVHLAMKLTAACAKVCLFIFLSNLLTLCIFTLTTSTSREGKKDPLANLCELLVGTHQEWHQPRGFLNAIFSWSCSLHSDFSNL